MWTVCSLTFSCPMDFRWVALVHGLSLGRLSPKDPRTFVEFPHVCWVSSCSDGCHGPRTFCWVSSCLLGFLKSRGLPCLLGLLLSFLIFVEGPYGFMDFSLGLQAPIGKSWTDGLRRFNETISLGHLNFDGASGMRPFNKTISLSFLPSR